MAPFDYGTCNPVIGSYHTINTQSTCTVSYHVIAVQPRHPSSQLPLQHLYCPITLPHQHPYNHLSSILPHFILSLGHITYRLPRVTCIHCHMSILYWSNLTQKCQNRVTRVTSWCCHVFCWCHHDVTCRTADINNTTCWLWPVWLFAFLGNQSERDNIHIQCPLAKKNMARINVTGRKQWRWFCLIPRTLIFRPS